MIMFVLFYAPVEMRIDELVSRVVGAPGASKTAVDFLAPHAIDMRRMPFAPVQMAHGLIDANAVAKVIIVTSHRCFRSRPIVM